MSFHDLNPDDLDPTGDPCEVIEVCPICGGRMEVVYDRVQSKVCVCVDCHSGIAVPAKAFEVARAKREAKDLPEP
jgi:ribosomal protein L37AE/L43A